MLVEEKLRSIILQVTICPIQSARFNLPDSYWHLDARRRMHRQLSANSQDAVARMLPNIRHQYLISLRSKIHEQRLQCHMHQLASLYEEMQCNRLAHSGKHYECCTKAHMNRIDQACIPQ